MFVGVLANASNCNVARSEYSKYGSYPANIYLFKVKNRSTKNRCEICSNLIIKTLERCHWRRSGVFMVNFENISHFFLVFLLLILHK